MFSLSECRVPDNVVVEQASSELTADFVASLMPGVETVVDLTAGLGVNTYLFSLQSHKVYAIEIDLRRAGMLRHNLNVAGVDNVQVFNDDCIEWLAKNDLDFDVAFVDPSRRVTPGKRSICIQDCEPSVEEIIKLLEGRCRRLLVKASPLLDLTSAFKTFPLLGTIYIVESQREVKELILSIDLKKEERTFLKKVICVKLDNDNTPIQTEFDWDDRSLNSEIPYLSNIGEIKDDGYLYDPSPALMKSGMFGALCQSFKSLKKLSVNSHLFYSDSKISDFPGRIFKIDKFLKTGDLKQMKKEEINVISRNHPANAEEISKRYQFSGRTSRFLIMTSIGHTKIMILGIKEK